MIHLYSPDRLRSLRRRALLSQREVERLGLWRDSGGRKGEERGTA